MAAQSGVTKRFVSCRGTFAYFWELLGTLLLGTFGYFLELLDTFGYSWVLLDFGGRSVFRRDPGNSETGGTFEYS